MTLASQITADPNLPPHSQFALGVALSALERAVERDDMTAVLEQATALDGLIRQLVGETGAERARQTLERAAQTVQRLMAELVARQADTAPSKADPRRAYTAKGAP